MKISVAVCTYNAELFLEQQLNSIINQSVPVDEIVICDDQSSDTTGLVIQDFLNAYPGKVQFHRNENNLGPVKNFEKCIQLCSGDLIFLSDQDDLWLPDKVEKMIECFTKDPKALLFFSNGALINDKNDYTGSTLWETWSFTEELRKDWLNNKKAFSYLLCGANKITGATVTFRKELKKYMFPFNLPELYYHDAWLGLLASGMGGLRFTEQCLIKYRVHQSQQVGVGNGVALDNRKSPSFTFNKNYISYSDFIENVYKTFPKHKPGFYFKLTRKVKDFLKDKKENA